MSVLDLAAIAAAPARAAPFPHFVVPGAIRADALAAIHRDFPAIAGPGSFPSWTLGYGAGFAGLVAALEGEDLARLVGDKLGIDLGGRPTMLTVRGHCRASDGRIHTDSAGKLVTALFYLNSDWDAAGGRLRLLNNDRDLDDYILEVPPAAGTLLAFRCTENAWHGHESFEGERRSLQLNWVTGRAYLWREQARHSLSAFAKRLRAS